MKNFFSALLVSFLCASMVISGNILANDHFTHHLAFWAEIHRGLQANSVGNRPTGNILHCGFAGSEIRT